jgi:multidrug efflux pump subunit AcrB
MHKKQSRMVPFIFGLILGILCMIYLPKYVRPYLPESMAKKEIVLKGTVVAKENKGDALLLTVNTPEGALLATFKQKTGEISRLINEKDEIQLTVPNYTPFIDEPKIIRVVKEQQAVSATIEAPAAPAKPVGKSTKELKKRHQAKLQAAPAPKSSMDVKPPAAAPTPESSMDVKPQAAAPAPESPTEMKPQVAAPTPESPMEVKPPDQWNNAPTADDKKTEQ